MAKRGRGTRRITVRVQGYEEIKTKIAGVTYKDPKSGKSRQDIIRRYVRPGKRLIAKREPRNKHGKGHAVGLWLVERGCLFKRKFHLGYIPSDKSENISKVLKAKVPVEVIVRQVWGGTKSKPARGVGITIRYPI